LEIDRAAPVIVHSSLSSFGEVNGGAEAIVGALLASFNQLVMPAFTYMTMLTPETGPEGNGITYGSGKDGNRMAEFFRPDMPVDKMIGAIPETLRLHPKAKRSGHPILSFVGVNAEAALEAQTLQEPLAPIRVLAKGWGWVLLLGVDHTVNTSIHYAERVAGSRQFTRWALTPAGIVECPGFPGCSNGFSMLESRLNGVTRQARAGSAVIQAIPLLALVETVKSMIAEDPQALLCDQTECERCQSVRREAMSVMRDT
jgi:aminoglycoside 3-N-acetyltransferase